MTAPVFVSHSSRDLKSVRALVEALEARGVPCWMSERDIAAGDNYGDSIVDAIERASAMVLVFSSAADNSDEIKKEIALASQRRITVVPVRIEDVTPSKAFRYELATRNWIDLFPDRERGVARLADRLAAILAVPLQAPAPRPGPSPSPASRPTFTYALGAAAALVAAAAMAWFTLRPTTPPTPIASISIRQVAPAPAAAPTSPLATTSFVPSSPSPSIAAAPKPTPTVPTPVAAATPVTAVTPVAVVTPVAIVSPAPEVSPATMVTPTAAAAIPTAPPTPVATPSPEAPTPVASEAPAPSATVAALVPAPIPSLAASPTPAPSPSAPAKPASLPIGPPPAIAANDPGGEVFRECDDCPAMVVVPGGKTMLGSPSGEPGRKSDEIAPHEVDIAQPFAVARHATTFDEWDACVADGGCNNRRPGDYGFGRKSRPVILVSWNDAQAYVDWLKRKTGQPYRLLSEAEWEYAARGCVSLKCPYAPFWFGPIRPELAVYDTRFAYEGSPKASATLKTASAESGAPNPFGLYNMLGNVRQWVADCWSTAAPPARSDGAPRLSGDCEERVTRGGSWSDPPSELRASARSWESADERSPYIGFRLARTLAP